VASKYGCVFLRLHDITSAHLISFKKKRILALDELIAIVWVLRSIIIIRVHFLRMIVKCKMGRGQGPTARMGENEIFGSRWRGSENGREWASVGEYGREWGFKYE
jgi:hypothetical protein